MDFREEYKKSAESLSPDKEAMERMKAAVLAEIAEEQSSGAAPGASADNNAGSPEQKKSFPFRRIAYIGGAVAACAVITVSAFTFLPMIKGADNMIWETSSAAVESSIKSAADTNGTGAEVSGAGAADSAPAADSAADMAEDAAADAYDDRDFDATAESAAATDSVVGSVNPDSIIASLRPAGTQPDAESDGAQSEAPAEDGYDDDIDEIPDNDCDNGAGAEINKGHDSVEPAEPDRGNPDTGTGFAETCDAGSAETGVTADIQLSTGESGFEETAEIWFTCDSSYDCDIMTEEEYEEPEPDPVLVFGSGWITFSGNRYYPAPSVTAGSIRDPLVISFQNPTDGKYYHVKLSSDKRELEIYTSDWKFISGWAKK